MILNRRTNAIHLKKRNLITYSNPDSVVSDQFRTIRTNITFLTGETDNRVFLITSPGAGEGKSTTIANLAVSLAQQKEKVLLIDANLREPIIDSLFKVPNRLGLTDVLHEHATLDEAVYATGIGKLDILTSGSMTFNPGEVLGNEIMTRMLQGAGVAYDTVLIDSPAVLQSTETRVLANQCDGVVLVLTRGKTTMDKAAEAGKVLELSLANLVGSIIIEK
ncbi:CpsD/CapB family tyrosine-protein kinase [Virgibacillus doumboii]|uniref:CpsD/CapB family tyrosine-protein kinase n=1 Tax=Virgibacillus doumboii TaxID=2697503 RepID=UPI0013DF1450|nr:CpsD/CapB family tyrosine-protein kinase [Virgibacillus doumboii]